MDAVAAQGARVTLSLRGALCGIVRDPRARLRAAAAENAARIEIAVRTSLTILTRVAIVAIKPLAGAALN